MRWHVTGSLACVMACYCPDCDLGKHTLEGRAVKTDVIADTRIDAIDTARWKIEGARNMNESVWLEGPYVEQLEGGDEE